MASAVRPSYRPLLVALALVATTLAGCDKKTPAQPEGDDANTSATRTPDSKAAKSAKSTPNITYKDGPAPTPDTVIAEAGDIEVTLADFQRSMQRSMLIAPEGQSEVPKERLASPHLQINVVRNLLSTKIVAHEAKRRGLEATVAEKLAAMKSKGQLAKYAGLLETGLVQKGPEEAQPETPAELAEKDLTIDDLDSIATGLVLEDKLRAALLAEISDEKLWQAYEAQNDQIQLLLVSARNTPTMEEIGAFVEEQPERVKTHFEANKKHYRNPTMVQLVMLSPEPGKMVDKARLEQAAQRLGGSEAPGKIAQDLGLRLDENALLVRGENTDAFGADPGKTGFQMSGARGAYAWRVAGMRKSTEAKLTAALKREIAAQLLRSETIVPSKKSRIDTAIGELARLPTTGTGAVYSGENGRQNLKTKLEEKTGLDVHITPMFHRNARGFIPKVGLAEEVAEKAFSMTISHPVAKEPILSRGKVWAIRVLARQTGTREQFEKEKDTFHKQFAEQHKSRVVTQFVNAFEDAHNARLNLDALRIKYGMLQKN